MLPEIVLAWVLWMGLPTINSWRPQSGHETALDCEIEREFRITDMTNAKQLGRGFVELQNGTIMQFSCFPSNFDPRRVSR
jgi:hypothetical protein